jgi:hypothetical protein
MVAQSRPALRGGLGFVGSSVLIGLAFGSSSDLKKLSRNGATIATPDQDL